jgi:carboxylesterase type B
MVFPCTGQSSGAACAHLHLIANKTTQYFRSGVSLSGSAFTHWAIKSQHDSKRLTRTLANIVNCPTKDTWEMVHCLKQKNPVELVSAQFRLLVSNKSNIIIVMSSIDLLAFFNLSPQKPAGILSIPYYTFFSSN